jgi:hypothetical protein
MKTVKLLTVVAASLLLANCSTKTYQIKSEDGKTLNAVPSWYMANYNESKACDLKVFNKEDNDKMCIFGVGTAVSPDLNLSIEKAKMIAKAELADIIKGEMNKQSKQFITELGKTNVKTVVSEVESTLVNVIKDTPVRGYEVFEQDVTLTKVGYYRAWVGLRLPMGEFNKMYNYTIEEVVDAYNLKKKANESYKEVLGNGDGDNSLQ